MQFLKTTKKKIGKQMLAIITRCSIEFDIMYTQLFKAVILQRFVLKAIRKVNETGITTLRSGHCVSNLKRRKIAFQKFYFILLSSSYLETLKDCPNAK